MTDLADQPARDRVESDTTATLFVEAGAGTGKTYALVRRLSTLLLDDEVPIDQIAAITFTEKAAAELRDRLRVHLVDRRDKGCVRADAALAGLDTAAIGTLHSFALRLLSENPLEAGIPPRVTAQQDTAEAAAVDALWQECATLLFGSGPTATRDGDLARAVDDMLDAGVSPTSFREVVEALHRDWDRLPAGPLHDGSPLPPTPDLGEVAAAVASIVGWRDSCQDETDLLYRTLGKHQTWLEDLDAALADATSSPTWVELLGKPVGPGNGGKGPNWGGADVVKGIKDEIKQLPAICEKVMATHWRPRIQLTLDALIPVVRRHADERRRHGTLQFHDQLVLARELLHHHGVRERVRDRYRRILIDEFQDTDPIQLELAELLTSAGDGSGPEPGRLFTVGDPKQSIYRFRRADISTYLRARGGRDQSAPGVEIEQLSTNFRCSRAVLDWVNKVFDEVLLPVEGVQPEYRALDSAPTRPEHDPAHGPAPFVFRTEDVPEHCPDDANDGQRRHWAEAADVARVIATAIRQGWTHESKDGQQTPLRLGDIAILLPSRGSLPMLETCLDHAGIDYRTEASSIVYGTPEIRELLLAVLTDDAEYMAEPSLRRRDRHWVERLASRCWAVRTVYSSAVFMDPQGEAEKLAAAVDEIVATRTDGAGGPAQVSLPERLEEDPDPAEPAAGGTGGAEQAGSGGPDSAGTAPADTVPTTTSARGLAMVGAGDVQQTSSTPGDRGPRPEVRPGQPLSRYGDDDFDVLVAWISADGQPRTVPELRDALRAELGIARRGTHVDAVLGAAARRSGLAVDKPSAEAADDAGTADADATEESAQQSAPSAAEPEPDAETPSTSAADPGAASAEDPAGPDSDR